MLGLIIALIYTWGGIIFTCIRIGKNEWVSGYEVLLTVLLWVFSPIITVINHFYIKRKEKRNREKWQM